MNTKQEYIQMFWNIYDRNGVKEALEWLENIRYNNDNNDNHDINDIIDVIKNIQI